jgi:hypothetical protein
MVAATVTKTEKAMQTEAISCRNERLRDGGRTDASPHSDLLASDKFESQILEATHLPRCLKCGQAAKEPRS